jgi:hypothetical protein
VIARTIDRVLALSALMIMPLAIRWLSLPNVLALCDRWPAMVPVRATPRALARRVHRWLAHGRGPWSSTCLTRSIVLYVMLRQHRYEPRFVVGVQGAEQAFDAHAWVTVGGVPVADPPETAASYTQLVAHSA